MKQFLTPHFWFTLRGDLSVVSSYLLIALILLFVIALAYLKINEGTYKKTVWRSLCEKLSGFFVFNLIVAIYLWFVTDQVVPVLSARIWFVIWGAEMALWIRSLYKVYSLVPERRKQLEANKEKNKYIP